MNIIIDVGGTNIRVAGFKSLNQPKIIKILKFPAENNYQIDFKNIVKAIQKITNSRIKRISIGLPGVISNGKIKKCSHLSDWNDKPVDKDLIDLFECPVILENDTTMAAYGEAIYGHGLNKNFLFINWGTGIGGSRVYWVDKKIHISSLEPGHHIINWNENLRCACGQRGCWESFCAGHGIQKRYKKQIADLSEKEWKEVIEYFTQGLINLIVINPTGLIVVGGGIAINQKKRIKQIKQILKKRLRIYPLPRIKTSKYGEIISLYGGLGLFKSIL